MSKKEEEVYMKNRDEWRNWLSRNHDKLNVIWLVYFKKHTKKSSITYNEAVEEALCFGWIDSTVNRIDEERYRQKFTPRNDKSFWSDLNKKRVAKLIKESRMTEFGREKVDIAKENGMWYKEYPVNNAASIPKEFSSMLEKDSKARSVFNTLTSSQKKQYINWISSAKKEETKIKRSKDAIKTLKKNRILGMK